MPIFRDNSSANRTAENGLLGSEAVTVPAFLWRAHAQSGYSFISLADAAVVIGSLEAKGIGARTDRERHTWVADPSASFSETLRFTRVYIKRNGKWLLAALHNAVPLPPHPPAK